MNFKKYLSYSLLFFAFSLTHQITYAAEDPIDEIRNAEGDSKHLKHQEEVFSRFLKARNRKIEAKFEISANQEVYLDTLDSEEFFKTEKIHLYKKQAEVKQQIYLAILRDLKNEFIAQKPKRTLTHLVGKIIDSVLYPPLLVGFIPQLNSTIKAATVAVPIYRSSMAIYEYYENTRNTYQLFRLEEEEFYKELKILSFYVTISLLKPDREFATKKIIIQDEQVKYEKQITSEIIEMIAIRIIDHIRRPEKKSFTEHLCITTTNIFSRCYERLLYGYKELENEELMDAKKRGNYYFTQRMQFYQNLPSYNLCFHKNYDIMSPGLEFFFQNLAVVDGGESAY